MRAFVGRSSELARGKAAVDRALAGEGALVCFVGEPGIGKSRLVETVSALAEERGARVAWGRCWEAGGAPAYWPFVEICRALELQDPLEDADSIQGPGATEARFDVFDRVTRRLKALAEARPLVLVVDDVHAADVPSLLLLQFLVRALRGSKLCVLVTYRETEARLNAEAATAIAKIAREGEVVHVTRLSRDDVGEWVAQQSPGSAAERIDEVHRLSEGNPLFVEELLRFDASIDTARLTHGLEAVVDEHLARVSREALALLEAAAVLGRDFAPELLRSLVEQDADSVDALLRAAHAAGVTQPGGVGRVRFNHILLRDRLYAALAPSHRASLHWKAGLLLRERLFDLASAAHHLTEGHSAGELELALEVSRDAAGQALMRMAFEDAARIAERGLALIVGRPVSRLGLQLELAAAEGRLRSGDTKPALAACVRAAHLAGELGAADLLGQAALTYSAELVSATVDPIMVDLLRRALAALDPEDSPLRARLLARLASALTPPSSPGVVQEISGLADDARAMARRLGDPLTSLYVSSFVAAATGYLYGGEQRFALVTEVMTLAAALNHRPTLVTLGGYYAVCLLERGMRAEADAALENVERAVADLRVSHYQWRVTGLHALFRGFDGDLTEAIRLGQEFREQGRKAGSRVSALAWAIQRIGTAHASGDAASIAADAADVLACISHIPQLSPYQAWVLAATGRREEATRALGPVAERPYSFPWLLIAADACSLLGDTEIGAVVYRALHEERFQNRVFWGPAALSVIGPTSLVLGDLALVLGRREEALRHYDDAVALTQQIGAKGLAALSLARRARAIETTGARPEAPPKPAQRLVEARLEGDVWAVSSESGVVRVKDGKGMRYLAELLRSPGRELFVLDLIGSDEAPTSGGVSLDARAKQEYGRRLEELRDALAEAESLADAGRAEKARAELDAIADELAGAVGLGGRDRALGSNVERARINVQRRLKDALGRIAELDPTLGRYLSSTVKTGTYCSFTPL